MNSFKRMLSDNILLYLILGGCAMIIVFYSEINSIFLFLPGIIKKYSYRVYGV